MEINKNKINNTIAVVTLTYKFISVKLNKVEQKFTLVSISLLLPYLPFSLPLYRKSFGPYISKKEIPPILFPPSRKYKEIRQAPHLNNSRY